jgi:S-adenosylmethionine-diacylgycerolhomoserine-N-methlytransferase
MSLIHELRSLYHLTLAPIRGDTHAERLESFYKGQAGSYDQFRRRLLRGREELYAALPIRSGDVVVEMGAGTGGNLEFLGERVALPEKIYLVDLSESLLGVAAKRARERGWRHVETALADATAFVPAAGPADVVTFSYSLTMIPDWFAAIDQAYAILKPGGTIGVVDFYVSRKHPEKGRVRHSWPTRVFWPTWFGFDNVCLSSDHVPYLHRKFEPVDFHEKRNWMPYLPGLRVPYYWFVGRKPGEDGASAST